MASDLSPQTERYLDQLVAGGVFPSKQAALEAAVQALRAKNETLPLIPAEHLELIEQGMASARAGRTRALGDADWQRLRQFAQDAASANRPSTD
jgi:Arc/MetJ-type ribon-helix-helix transcriptional regulator